MNSESTRNKIIELLCDTTIFESDKDYYSWEVNNIIKSYLNNCDVKDIYKSIRAALETVNGYDYSNGTSCKSHRNITTEKVIPPVKPNPRGYNVLYHFH
ncbi:MAG: hypothetical protein J6K48_03245 [Lachnospiraceae bacterium]|nr:hypothetical protein [Lachnospiraceae bacterium]